MSTDNAIIKFIVKPFDVSLYLKIVDNKLAWADAGEPDLEITVTPSSLLKIKTQGFEKCIKDQSIKISGDMMVAMKLRELIETYNFDVETKIANVFGDFAAAQYALAASKVNKFRTNIAQSFAQDVKEFVEDELQVVVTAEEVAHFVAAVDELRFAVDRIEALYANRRTSN